MLKSFLKGIILDLVVLLLCGSVFVMVFLLNDISSDIFLYPFILSLFFLLVMYGYKFYKYANKYQVLNDMDKKIEYEIGRMPETENEIEKAYQKIIEKLYRINNFEKSEFDKKSTEMVDYYSLWAHQIKTPIAAMRILLQSNENNYDVDREYISDMENELFKVEQYVEMVLSYLRINSESSDYVFKKCDMDKIIKQCVRKYSKLFIAKKISLNITDTNINIVTDEKWMSFVIEQIISNALKYTNKGSISIYCKNSILFITDTGIGISAEDIPRVCEKGFTGYNGRTDRKSTGIGLYLCKQILKKLNLTISIESEIGKGTTVMVDLNQEKIEIH